MTKRIIRTMVMLVVAVLLFNMATMTAYAAETHETSLEGMPLYNQYDFAHVPYMRGTIAKRGCGITSLSMVASYLLDDETLTPEYLAKVYGDPNNPVEGVDYTSLKTVMVSTGELLGLKMDIVWTFQEAYDALKDGKVVITLQNEGCFTSRPNGHFVVFAGVNDAGKVLVNDPNGYTYNTYPDYFRDGFPTWELWDTGSGYWICEAV